MNLGIPVVEMAWLDELKSNGSGRNPMQLTSKYLLRPLHGLLLCVTGFDADEREDMKRICEKLGGTFSLDLTKSCTHLIAKTASGAKYEHGKKWGLHVVSKEWLLQVDSKNSYIEPQLYSLEPQGTTNEEIDIHESFDSYLDSCNLFLPVDLDSKQLSSLKKQIRQAGGTVSTGVVDGFVTHCLVLHSTLSQSDIRRFSTCRPKLPILSLDWLYKCFSTQSLVPFEGFYCGETGVGLLKLHRLNSSLLSNTTMTTMTNGTTTLSNSHHPAPILSSLSSTKRIKVSKNTSSRSFSVMDMDLSDSPVAFQEISIQKSIPSRAFTVDSEKYSHLLEPKLGLFHGKSASSIGFSENQVTIIIKELEKNGAKFKKFKSMECMESIDFLIVPFEKHKRESSLLSFKSQIVTELWLESCLQVFYKLEISFYSFY